MSKIVKRTLDFFEVFAAEKRPLSLSEISRLLNIPMSSCFDVVQALQERGYVSELGQRGGYYPTLKLQRLGGVIAEHDPILLRAGMTLRALRDEIDESVSLARSTGRQVTYLLVFEPSHALRFLVRVGDEARSLHATSVGKAFLGSLDAEAFEQTMAARPLDPLTENTITDLDALRRDIEAGRSRGYFLNREESVLTATTITAPFRWNRSDFFVTVAGPTHRIEPKLDGLVARLKAVCAELGET